MDWYAVKMIYQMKICGKPKQKDTFYTPDQHTFFEESVLLLQAESFEHAYELAESSAHECCEPYTNKYGQLVETKVFAYVDCFLIGNQIESGSEVYSSIFTEKGAPNQAALLKKRYQSSSESTLHMLRNIKFC